MKRNTSLLLLLALCAGGLLTACKKTAATEEDYGPRIIGLDDSKAAVTTGAWYFAHEAVVYGPDDVDHGGGDACKEDDQYRFDLNGDAAVQWGPNDCFGWPIPSGSYASWALFNDGNSLRVSYTRQMPGGHDAGDVVLWDVSWLSQRKMVLRRNVQEYNKSYTLYDTYIKR
ncbi:hypothetical protein [Flaviaesturariibacter terrae]